jgi:hypothetical protein
VRTGSPATEKKVDRNLRDAFGGFTPQSLRPEFRVRALRTLFNRNHLGDPQSRPYIEQPGVLPSVDQRPKKSVAKAARAVVALLPRNKVEFTFELVGHATRGCPTALGLVLLRLYIISISYLRDLRTTLHLSVHYPSRLWILSCSTNQTDHRRNRTRTCGFNVGDSSEAQLRLRQSGRAQSIVRRPKVSCVLNLCLNFMMHKRLPILTKNVARDFKIILRMQLSGSDSRFSADNRTPFTKVPFEDLTSRIQTLPFLSAQISADCLDMTVTSKNPLADVGTVLALMCLPILRLSG